MSQTLVCTKLVHSITKTLNFDEKMEVAPLIDWDKHIVVVKNLDFLHPLYYMVTQKQTCHASCHHWQAY